MTMPDSEVLTSRIVELFPGRRLTDLTDVDGVSVRVDHDLSAGEARTTVTYRMSVEGAVPDDVAAEIGSEASADFPQVLAALAARAERS